MEKQFTFSGDEYNKILQDKDDMRKHIKELNSTIRELEERIEYMKTEKEDVLVVVKDKEKHDEYVLKTKEKEVLKELIKMNKELIEKNEENIRQLYNINDMLTDSQRKTKELEDLCLSQSEVISKKDEYIEYLKNRGFIDRILNKDEAKDEEYISEKDKD